MLYEVITPANISLELHRNQVPQAIVGSGHIDAADSDDGQTADALTGLILHGLWKDAKTILVFSFSYNFV